MDVQNIEVGKRITELRLDRGYTREKLSELADVSVQFLADIEKGRKSMTVATLRKLSAALLVSTDYIVNGTAEQDDNFPIISILNTLSEKDKKRAEIILTAFAEAVNSKD
ncbi:MAG: helix-turn-helix transcriptional regulator [Oscillospiraceae bacterium]|nr:helix-turn-helix transcriptional regulator [Oscillospiraceae bacterium]